MRRIESQAPDQADLAKQALSFVVFARCPWTAAELCHALTVKLGESEPDWDAMPSLQAIMTACSGMMVTVGSEERDEHGGISDIDEFDDSDEDSDSDEVAMMREVCRTTVRLDRIAVGLAHRTAHEYLQRTCERWLPEAEKQMTATCMAYLSLRYFSDGSCYDESDLELRLRIFPLCIYAALHWEFHARTVFGKFPDLAGTQSEFLGSSAFIEGACDAMPRVGQWPRDDVFWNYPGGMNWLHIAAYFGIANLVRSLGIRAGAMVNQVDTWGFTALTWATKQGHKETVQVILKFPATDVDIRDNRARTPISLAAKEGHIAIVKMLLDHGANPNLKDFNGATPLWHAAKGGHTTTAAVLVRCGVDLNVLSTVDGRMHTPLSLAAMRGQDEMVRLLLAQPNIQPRGKMTMSSWDPEVRDSKVYPSPVELAVNGGHSNAVEMLLSNPGVAAAARAGEEGGMLLHSAASKGHEKIVRLLLSHDFDVNTRDHIGRTPLHLAIAGLSGVHDGIARLLLAQASVEPDLADDNGATPALSAAVGGQIGTLRLLLAKGVSTEARTIEGLTLLGVAAQQGYLPIVELLLAMDGVDADSRDAFCYTPLTWAANPSRAHFKPRSSPECDRDHCGVVQCLLDSGQVDINARVGWGQTPLMYATRGHNDYISCFRAILDHEGVEINAADNQGQTALSLAVAECKQDKAILLLEKGADPNLGQFFEGKTLLSHAASCGMTDVVRRFICHHGVDPQEKNLDGHTALCKAVAGNEVEVLKVLLDVGGVDVNARCSHGQMPLHHAAEQGGEKVVSLLLAKGRSGLNAQDVGGRTPLHHGAERGSEALVSLLLDGGVVNANCRDLMGRTPLSLAAQQGQLHVIEKLLSFKGVIPDLKDNTGRTPLSWAIQSKAKDPSSVVKRFLGAEGVDPNVEDERGWTPLSWAVQNSKASNMVELLLTEGAGRIDINHEDWKDRTPLTLALKKGHEVIVGQLRAAGAREGGLSECRASLGSEENGIDMTRKEADGPACEERRDAQQDSDGDSLSCISEGDSWEEGSWGEDFRQMERTQRRRWLNPDWFDDAPTDSNSGWNGTNDTSYRKSLLPSIETQIELEAQNELGSGEGGDEEDLCPLCKALDLDQMFSHDPPGGFRVIANLGKVDKTWESRPCAMCKLIAAVRPQVDNGNFELCAYSSTATWLLRDRTGAKDYFMSNWVDTVILGVESGTSHYSALRMDLTRSPARFEELDESDILPNGFISRIGSNDRHRLRAMTVHQLQENQADFSRARGWIACCVAHHGKRCNPGTRRPITSFRLIDCTTRDIVDGQSAMDNFVALRYVWGPVARKPAAANHVRVERAERVVEDAIRATQALGYRYLWVDRHCITNQDEEIRKKQLLEMNAVYANAQVTIVAAAGEDSAFGLPGVSRARQQPCARIQGHSLVAVPSEPAQITKESVWWTRGWTFQEGVLSRRRLIFTEHEVSYECQGMVARESIELPERIHRITATSHPIHEYARVVSRWGYENDSGGNFSIWSQISEYTKRHLTHDYDILNAMLGIMEVAAERKAPVYNLCGVPIVLGSPGKTDGQTLLEAFLTGLCWKVSSGTRREGFPSWSWTGWKGKAYGPDVSEVYFKFSFPIEVSMVPRDDPSETLSWAEFEAMRPKEKAALPQDYILKITGTSVDVSIRREYRHSLSVILYHGDVVLQGSIRLSKDPEQDPGFRRRLAVERLTAIAIGNKDIFLAVIKVGEYWERIGVIKVESEHVLDVRGGGCRRQTFLIK